MRKKKQVEILKTTKDGWIEGNTELKIPEGTNTYKAEEADQYYALKRAVCILEGHIEDKFKNPLLCQAFWEGYNHLNGLLKKYQQSLKNATDKG